MPPHSPHFLHCSLELQLLIDLTRRADDNRLKLALDGLNKSHFHKTNFNWEYFTDLAQFHRVESLVALNLGTNPDALISEHIRNHFASRLKQHALDSLMRIGATIEIAKVFKKENIKFILLKSDAIGDRFYKRKNGRQSIDIDILIAQNELARARLFVEALGFEQMFPNFIVPKSCKGILETLACDIAYRRPKDNIQLDLHWRFFKNPNLMGCNFDALIEAGANIQLADIQLPVLDLATQMEYMLCHGSKHSWFRLKWLADIYRMQKDLSPSVANQIIHHAQINGTMRMVSISTILVKDIYQQCTDVFDDDLLLMHNDVNLLVHIKNNIMTPAHQTSGAASEIKGLLNSLWYLLNLKPDLNYKKSVIVNYFSDIRDINRFHLSQKWLWFYVIMGPILGASRIIRRKFKSQKQDG